MAGHDLERLVAGWLASCAFNAALAPMCHLPPPGCWGGEAEAAFKCPLSVLQLGAGPGERFWQHLIQGADVRGKNTLIHKTLSLGFAREPQRLSARGREHVHEVKRGALGSWDSCWDWRNFLVLIGRTSLRAASAGCSGECSSWAHLFKLERKMELHSARFNLLWGFWRCVAAAFSCSQLLQA